MKAAETPLANLASYWRSGWAGGKLTADLRTAVGFIHCFHSLSGRRLHVYQIQPQEKNLSVRIPTDISSGATSHYTRSDQRLQWSGENQLRLDCNGAAASPPASNHPACFAASTWQTNFKTRKGCRCNNTHAIEVFVPQKNNSDCSSIRWKHWFFVLASFPSLTAGSLDSFTIVLLGY